MSPRFEMKRELERIMRASHVVLVLALSSSISAAFGQQPLARCRS